jgi:restriction system protein
MSWAGSLSSLQPNREAFKVRVAEVYPDKKAGAIASSEGQTL